MAEPPTTTVDPVIRARELIAHARNWIRSYARIVAEEVPPEDIEAVIQAVGELSFSEACDAIDKLAAERRQVPR